MPRRGRPCELTPANQKKICKALADGNTRKHSALSIGIHYTTFLTWFKTGKRQKNGKFHDFYNAVKKAEALAITNAIKWIRTAGKKQWQALAWITERKCPDEWGSDRGEIAKLRKILEELTKRVPPAQTPEPPSPETGSAGNVPPPPPLPALPQ